MIIKYILHKYCHSCMVTKSFPQVGVKRDTRITTHICISGHWPYKMKLLKNPMKRLLYKILRNLPCRIPWHCLTSGTNQLIMKSFKPIIKVKYDLWHNGASSIASGYYRHIISTFGLLFTNDAWYDNWRCKHPMPSISSKFSGLVKKFRTDAKSPPNSGSNICWN